MKIWSVALVLFGFIVVAAAQEAGPEWFVLDNKNDSVAETDTNEPLKEIVSKKEVVAEQMLFKQLADDKYRFANNNKDLELAAKWLKKEFESARTQNILLSPLDFYYSSVLLANGVVDQTLVEFSKMFSVMRLTEVNQQVKTYIMRRNESTSIRLSLWGKVFSEHFSELMRKQLNVEIWGLKGTTAIINDWVKAKTKGEISNIVIPEAVGKADMFLASSAFFEANWQESFFSSKIEKKEAQNLNGRVVAADMLKGEGSTDYFEDDEMYAVRLFFNTGDFISLYLPKDADNFENFVKELNVNILKPDYEKKDVTVILPKFEVEYQPSMIKDVYKMWGVQKIFEIGNYEFAKMISFDTPAFVKDVFLKAKIKIKDGTSDGMSEMASAPADSSGKIIFNANRPFVFMINNGDFIGTIVKFD